MAPPATTAPPSAGPPALPAAPRLQTQAPVLAALLRSAINLLEMDDEQEVLQRFCDALTAQCPELLLAWTWFGAPDAEAIAPQVYAGRASAYAATLRVPRPDAVTAASPAYRVIGGEPLVLLGESEFHRLGPWHQVAQSYGIRDLLALPLISSVDTQRGVFLLYANREGWFRSAGVGLFEALADLFSAVLSRAARNSALQRAATRDALTGLLNRAALPALAQRLHRPQADDPAAALVMLDLDHFKRVNDLHGHPAGDAVLQGVARALATSLRSSDLCLRWGGEEFLLALPGTDGQQAQAVVEKLRQRLRAQTHTLPDGTALTVTASFGVAELRGGEALEHAIARADGALYAAKRGGRNRVVVD